MLVKSSLSGFRIPLCAIRILFRKSLPVSLFPLAVTALMWSYFINFGLIFVQNNVWIWLHSFVCGCPVCPAPFVRLDCLSCMFWHYWKFSGYNNMNLFLGSTILLYCPYVCFGANVIVFVIIAYNTIWDQVFRYLMHYSFCSELLQLHGIFCVSIWFLKSFHNSVNNVTGIFIGIKLYP